jgi:hypothetical protein
MRHDLDVAHERVHPNLFQFVTHLLVMQYEVI